MSDLTVEERLTRLELAITSIARIEFEQERDDNGRFAGGGGGGPGSMKAGEEKAAAAKAQAEADRFANAKSPVELLDKWQNGKGNFHEKTAIARDILMQTNPKAAELLAGSKAERQEAADKLVPEFKQQFDDAYNTAKGDPYVDDPRQSAISALSDTNGANLREFLSNPTPETLARADASSEAIGRYGHNSGEFYKGDGLSSVGQRAGHSAIDTVRKEVEAAGGDPMKPLGK